MLTDLLEVIQKFTGDWNIHEPWTILVGNPNYDENKDTWRTNIQHKHSSPNGLWRTHGMSKINFRETSSFRFSSDNQSDVRIMIIRVEFGVFIVTVSFTSSPTFWGSTSVFRLSICFHSLIKLRLSLFDSVLLLFFVFLLLVLLTINV